MLHEARWSVNDGFLPSRTMSCTTHAGYDVTASQARLHVDGEAAIPLRSPRPCRLGGLPPKPSFTSFSSCNGINPAGEYVGELPDWWWWISWAYRAYSSGQKSTIFTVFVVAEQDLIRGRLSRKPGPLSKRLVWGFKTTTGDGMI